MKIINGGQRALLTASLIIFNQNALTLLLDLLRYFDIICVDFEVIRSEKYSNDSSEMPSNHPANLLERLFCDKPVTTRPSLGSIAFTALALGQ